MSHIPIYLSTPYYKFISQLLEWRLRQNGIGVCKITGGMPLTERRAVLHQFNKPVTITTTVEDEEGDEAEEEGKEGDEEGEEGRVRRGGRAIGRRNKKNITRCNGTLSSSSLSVMILSLRAGGEGLNLQAASRVFVMEPWWNPAVESQVREER